MDVFGVFLLLSARINKIIYSGIQGEAVIFRDKIMDDLLITK